MTVSDPLLLDQPDRDRAITRTDLTLLVDAGAGSGKTHIMVERICRLVEQGVPIRSIAAVTFTESAASALRDRIRAQLARNAEHGSDRASAAVADLDAAAIGTLHAFARRILAEHPVQAQLPPIIEVLDDVASGVRVGRWWSSVRSALLDDPSMAQALGVLGALRVPVNARFQGVGLEGLALRMQSDWDLVEDHLADQSPQPIPDPDLSLLVRHLSDLEATAEACPDPDDKLRLRILDLVEWGRDLASTPDLQDQVELWQARPSVKVGKTGRSSAWPNVASVRDAVADLAQIQPFDSVLDAAVRQVVAYLGREILSAAQARRREGQLLYHDLLVLARQLLRSNEQVRRDLQAKYPHLLLDEFQDTDPIQIELAVRIAAGAAGGEQTWQQCPIPDGSLFVVGDPKQSIYRFRRADISTYLAAADFLAQAGSATLSTNFRSHKDILGWVNHVFTHLIMEQAGVQPPYVSLTASPKREHPDDHPRVFTLASTETGPDVEAAQVADIVATALTERWPFKHGHLTASDITVLVPARTSLNVLESAFHAAGVPYRLMARSLIYGSDQIRDLLMVAAAVDDPSNELLLVEALRTPVLGCGDDDLWRWRHAGGSWRLWDDPPTTVAADDPVAAALGFVNEMRTMRRTLSPSELLARIVRRRGLLPMAVATGDPRDIWRRYRIVVDQARQWAETAHGSLREYLTWASARAQDEDRANDIALPETDADAVSVMTIHAAKGLEFGMVVVTGLTRHPRARPGSIVWQPHGPEINLAKGAHTIGWQAAEEAEKERLLAEDRRVLYVACTRAEEYLAVSTIGPPGSRGQLLAAAAARATHQAWQPRGTVLPPGAPRPTQPLLPPAEWQASYERQQAAATLRAAVSAGAIAHRDVPEPDGIIPAGLEKDAQDLELPAWLKGRYGTAIGRAVHATLQTVDLVTGEGLQGCAEAQALAESVADRADVVAALARSAFDAPVVREAAARVHQKETYVGTAVDGVVVEGFVDLLFTDGNGDLVVVDYKTDADPSAQTVAAYRRQLAVYATALTDATGLAVARRVLVFCREQGPAFEIDV